MTKELFPSESQIVIDVLANNERGMEFWKSLGFEPYAINMKKRAE